jgi:ketosteroid isomerase-like protein
MAALDVMRRYVAAAKGGDWETAYGCFAENLVGHVPGRSKLAGTLQGRDAAIAYIEAAKAKSQGAEVQLELIDTLSSDERVMLLVCERFAREAGVVEIERANVYAVRGEEIVEIWIFEGDQYAVDELIAAS